MSLTIEALEAFVRKLAVDVDRWRPLVNHNPTQRTYEVLWADEDVNAWVLCWSEDHDTGFHDHDVSAAAITVIDGKVREERLCLGRSARETVYGAGQTFTVPPNAIHRVLHSGAGPAVTIHAYSPPLERMGSYSEGAEGELLRGVRTKENELTPELTLA